MNVCLKSNHSKSNSYFGKSRNKGQLVINKTEKMFNANLLVVVSTANGLIVAILY